MCLPAALLAGALRDESSTATLAATGLIAVWLLVAALTRTATGFFIQPVEIGEGQGPPTVNGKPIGSQAQPLNDNDVIELANVKMGFYLIK